MTAESITELLNAEPFMPFSIILTSGDKFHIRDPHLVVMQASQIFYAYPKSDRFTLLRLNQVAALDVNGRHKARA
jgi:hypothetical protein